MLQEKLTGWAGAASSAAQQNILLLRLAASCAVSRYNLQDSAVMQQIWVLRNNNFTAMLAPARDNTEATVPITTTVSTSEIEEVQFVNSLWRFFPPGVEFWPDSGRF